MQVSGGQRHSKADLAVSDRRQVVIPADQNRFPVTGLICRSGGSAAKAPGPASLVVRRIGLILPEKFLLMDLIELLGQKLVGTLVRPRVGRRRKRLGRRSLDLRCVQLTRQ